MPSASDDASSTSANIAVVSVLSQYATPDRLKDRLALHARYGPPEVPFHIWLFERAKAPQVAEVLEVGCGTGQLWSLNASNVPSGWKLMLTDLSAGMLTEARATLRGAGLRAEFRQLSVDDLGFTDSSFDLAFANHMLYHVPDVAAALAELRRVLRPGARLYCATNGAGHMRQVQEDSATLAAAVPELGLAPIDIAGFSLETGGAALERHFEHVTLSERREALVVTESEPYARYVLSLAPKTLAEAVAADPAAAGRFGAWLESLERRLADGPLLVDRATGFFEAY